MLSDQLFAGVIVDPAFRDLQRVLIMFGDLWDNLSLGRGARRNGNPEEARNGELKKGVDYYGRLDTGLERGH